MCAKFPLLASLLSLVMQTVSVSSAQVEPASDFKYSKPNFVAYVVERTKKSALRAHQRALLMYSYNETELQYSYEVLIRDTGLKGQGVVLNPDNQLCFTKWKGGNNPEVIQCGLSSSGNPLASFYGGDDWTLLQTDHVTSNVYWSDTLRSTLGVTNPQNNASTTLFEDCKQGPDGFDTDPYQGLLFICHHKTRYVTKRMLDEVEKPEVIDTFNGVCQGLTLDMESEFVYYVTWDDDGTASVTKVSYNGSGGSIVYDNSVSHDDLFGIKFFQQRLYILHGFPQKQENSGFKLVSFDPKTRQTEVVVTAPSNAVFRAIAIQESTGSPQGGGVDFCGNSTCSHICVLSLKSPKGYRCACGYGYILAKDEHGCEVSSAGNKKDPCKNAQEQYEAEFRAVTAVVVASIFLLALIILLIGFLAVAVYCIRKKHRLARILLSKKDLEEFLHGSRAGENRSLSGYETAMSMPFSHSIRAIDLVVDRDKTLGRGEFGVVYQGTLCGSDVAVKETRHQSGANSDYFKTLLSEIKIMAYLGKHPHIVEFKGADISLVRQGRVSLVFELSPFGNLLKYIRKHFAAGDIPPDPYVDLTDAEPEGPTPPPSFCLLCAAQIADGMAFLVEKQIFHGDLAARNVLVFRNYHVKITDFGMARHLYNYRKYTKQGETPLPWRWLALESIDRLEFSVESDVWAYGVTLWEIFSYGKVPYPESQWNQEFVTALRGGKRLLKPEGADEAVYKQMTACWHSQPSQRPTFRDLHQFFYQAVANTLLSSQDGTDTTTATNFGYIKYLSAPASLEQTEYADVLGPHDSVYEQSLIATSAF